MVLASFARKFPAAAAALQRAADKVHLGELWPDQITHVELIQEQHDAAKNHEIRAAVVRATIELTQRADLRAYVQAMRPEEFQPGAGGALPGTTLKKGGRFDLGRSLESGLDGDSNLDPQQEAKRQLVARRVDGGGNKGLAAITAGATTMGIFFLGPLGAAAGAGSLLVDAVKGPELIFVNGLVTPKQVKALVTRFEKARPLPRAITAAIVRRALERDDLDDLARARLRKVVDEASALPPSLLAEGERIATVALFARRLERRELAALDDDEAADLAGALAGLAPSNHAALAPWVAALLARVDLAPRLSPRAAAQLDAALAGE